MSLVDISIQLQSQQKEIVTLGAKGVMAHLG